MKLRGLLEIEYTPDNVETVAAILSNPESRAWLEQKIGREKLLETEVTLWRNLVFLLLDDSYNDMELTEAIHRVRARNVGHRLTLAMEQGILEESLAIMERLNPGPKARKATKEKKYAFIKYQARKELEKNPKLSKIEAKRRANKMMTKKLSCGMYGEEELKKIPLRTKND